MSAVVSSGADTSSPSADGTRSPVPAPIFRDPIYDGATDPVVVYNRAERAWWMVYTARRATAEGEGLAWVHGTDLGVASSTDGGANWLYRGTLPGLEHEWGRNTFWAPEIVWHAGQYHMFVSYIRGVPTQWPGHERHILHYTSGDLLHWSYCSRVALSSNYVIDAAVHPLPNGGFRMWFKDEAAGSATYAADCQDDELDDWDVIGPVLTHRGHEGPNVFQLGGWYWLIVDEWRGQGVFRSTDLTRWEPAGHILDHPGTRRDDATVGLHADVVVTGEQEAVIFYFTHPGTNSRLTELSHVERRSSIQVARLSVVRGALVCERDAPVPGPFLPLDGPRSA